MPIWDHLDELRERVGAHRQPVLVPRWAGRPAGGEPRLPAGPTLQPSLMLHRACTLRMPTAAAHTRCAGVGGRAGGGSGGADLLCLFERPGGVPGGARGCAGEHSGSSAPLGLQRRLTCRQSTAAVALREAPFSTSLCMAPRLGAEQQPQHCCCAPRASASTCHALLCRRACASCSSPPASSSSPLSRHAGRALCCSLA